MANSETFVWTIRGGRHGEADDLFLKKNRVALGWDKLPDLSKLAPTREAFKAAIKHVWPEKTEMAVANNAGQLFRFVHELEVGHLILYPSKVDQQIHIGRIDGPYIYNPSLQSAYPHTRTVKWLRTVPRTTFSQGALYEINAIMTFFLVKKYTDEFVAAIEGTTPPNPVEIDETVQLVAEEIEQTTQDFILKKLAKELKGHPFADFVAHLLEKMGYRTRVSPEGPDGGIDIVAHRDELGFEPPIIKVQVKSTESSIGDPVVSSLYGKVAGGEHGLLVTLGTFTSQAIGFARSKSNLRLIDGDDLVALILQHYDAFDSRYKGLIPLRRVFVPEPLDDGDEE